jgi:hypothetical protein
MRVRRCRSESRPAPHTHQQSVGGALIEREREREKPASEQASCGLHGGRRHARGDEASTVGTWREDGSVRLGAPRRAERGRCSRHASLRTAPSEIATWQLVSGVCARG